MLTVKKLIVFCGVMLCVLPHNLKNHIPIPLPLHLPDVEQLAPVEFINEYQPINWKYSDFDNEVNCLAKNIYYEARGQQIIGQIAVALVTFNRVKSNKFPNSICSVVWQKRTSKKTGKMVAQFSWTLDGNSNNPPNSATWKNIHRLAKTILHERSLDNFSDVTDGAMFYHNTSVNPYWIKSMSKVATIGEHIFYTN